MVLLLYWRLRPSVKVDDRVLAWSTEFEKEEDEEEEDD